MPVSSFYPVDGAAYENGGWTKVGSLGDGQSEQTNDGGTSYFSVPNNTGASAVNLLFDFADLPGDASGVNTVYYRGVFGRNSSSAGRHRFCHRVSPYTTLYYGAAAQLFPTSWNALTTSTSGINPGDGSSWGVTNFNGAKFGTQNQADGIASRFGYVTQLEAVVDYTASSFAFVTTFMKFFGVLHLPQMVAAAGAFAYNRDGRGKTRFTPQELEQIKRELWAVQRGYAFLGLQGA